MLNIKPLNILLLLILTSITTNAETLEGTLLRKNTADPCLIFDKGSFYLTMTGSSKVSVIKSSSLEGLSSDRTKTKDNIVYDAALDPTVKEIYGEDARINGTWSPEIHYFPEDEFPGNSGWYMYFALRKKDKDSRSVRMVVLKSTSGSPEGPYASPVNGVINQTQPMLGPDGKTITDWCLGPSVLRIPSGRYKGVYLMWVEEVGRGTGQYSFFQKIMISRISSPWKLEGRAGIITTPTQEWEMHGSSKTHPCVVEGGTAVYGDHGEVFLTYSGSGFWSDYGLGQLTLLRKGGDYRNPMKTKSWAKYSRNPVFSSAGSEDLRGAGHGFFLKDASGKRYFCYHAYPYVDGVKKRSRNAYIEPCSIDYSAACPTAPYGVIKMGCLGNGSTAPTATKITFELK